MWSTSILLFISWLLHFLSASLLILLEKQWKTAQGPWATVTLWETQMEFQVPDSLHPSLCRFLLLYLPLKTFEDEFRHIILARTCGINTIYSVSHKMNLAWWHLCSEDIYWNYLHNISIMGILFCYLRISIFLITLLNNFSEKHLNFLDFLVMIFGKKNNNWTCFSHHNPAYTGFTCIVIHALLT